MFLLVLFSLAMGFLLIAVLVFAKPSRPAVEPEGRRPEAASGFAHLTMTDFERLCLALVEEMGLVVSSYVRNGPRELEIAAVNPQPITGGDFVVHCTHPEDGFVGAARVNILRDQVKGEQAAKGIFITTGFFAEETSKVAEGPPLELINAKRLRELMRDYRIAV
ncbi:MAG TPA: restriction endonuclease [Candidatus Methylomirabilis sp.]|nr:restriction endonuclease [Candidatus Methylomirabilis sp.]